MAKISKGKFRWLRAVYKAHVPRMFYDREGTLCLQYLTKVFVGVRMSGVQGLKGPSGQELNNTLEYTIDFTGSR